MHVDCSERFLKVSLVSCYNAAVPGFNPEMKRLVQCVINRGLTLAKDCAGTMAAWRFVGRRGLPNPAEHWAGLLGVSSWLGTDHDTVAM